MLWGCGSLLRMLGAFSHVWMLLGANPRGPRWLLPTGAAERVRGIGDGTGGFGVSLGWICLSCSSTETQAHGGPSPGALCQASGWRGGTGTLARGVCQSVGDIPVVSFPHGDSSRNCPVPQQPPLSQLISHFQTLNFLIKTCSWSRAGLSSRRWGLWQEEVYGCLLHPPKPEGERRILGWSVIPHWGSAFSRGEQDPNVTCPFCPLQVPWRWAEPCWCCWC